MSRLDHAAKLALDYTNQAVPISPVPTATLAALVAAGRLCESLASVRCEHHPLAGPRRYWCTTWHSYWPCLGDEARDVMYLLGKEEGG